MPTTQRLSSNSLYITAEAVESGCGHLQVLGHTVVTQDGLRETEMVKAVLLSRNRLFPHALIVTFRCCATELSSMMGCARPCISVFHPGGCPDSRLACIEKRRTCHSQGSGMNMLHRSECPASLLACAARAIDGRANNRPLPSRTCGACGCGLVHLTLSFEWADCTSDT